MDYNINIEKERIEIPIYFSNKIDEEGIRDAFDLAIEDLLSRFKIVNGEIEDKS